MVIIIGNDNNYHLRVCLSWTQWYFWRNQTLLLALTGKLTLQTSPETVLGRAPLCAQVCKLSRSSLNTPLTTTTLPGRGAWQWLRVGGSRLWVSRSGAGNPYSAFLFKNYFLENNYFTVLWRFSPYINMSQPQVYLCTYPAFLTSSQVPIVAQEGRGILIVKIIWVLCLGVFCFLLYMISCLRNFTYHDLLEKYFDKKLPMLALVKTAQPNG